MPNFTKYFRYQYLKQQWAKTEVRIGIFIGTSILLIFSLLIFLIWKFYPKLLTPRKTVDKCVAQGMEKGRLYFQDKNNCRGSKCEYLHLDDTETQGFLEFAQQLQKDCEQKYDH